MTAAEQPSDFQSSLLVDELEDSFCLISNTMSDSDSNNLTNSVPVTSNMDEEKNSLDSKGSEFSGTSVTEEPGKIQCSPDSNAEISAKCTNEEWLDIMGSGDFMKKVIKPGLKDHRPHYGDKVIINISLYVKDFLFDKKKGMTLIVGDLDIFQGIDLALCLMDKGERAKVKIPYRLAYGFIGLPPNVPSNTDIECEIELKEIEEFEIRSLKVSERLKIGNEKRSRGNFFYCRSQYIDAIHCYERAAEYLDSGRYCSDDSPEQLQEIVNERLKVLNNMAASHLKLSAYNAALKSVDAVLKVQPKNVKALYRKGKVLVATGKTDEAIACVKLAASLEPETKAIQRELTRLQNIKKKELEYQRAMYRKMFNREPVKAPSSFSTFRKWSMISCGVLAVAIGSAVAYRQLHT